MARIGGRSTWIAVPAGMLCVGVVAALVWLALPMFPVAVDWVGDSLRAASRPAPVAPAEPTPAERAVASESFDCRAIYPDSPVVRAHVAGRSASQPDGGTPRDRDHVARRRAAAEPPPHVLVAPGERRRHRHDARGRRRRRLDDRRRGAARSGIHVRAGCAAALRCVRVRGDVIEEHTVRGTLWLSSMETKWHPEEYGLRIEAEVWG